ncbi:hypothetical protein [uncultured Pontibacter sp.]|uniref:hypothetical protein n=1 Tax=uncultured Pontibacter sp. TaxID=453356 RepID=UPI00261D1249|nr:hypothetical protein [uncultured Pontibacter sp.]
MKPETLSRVRKQDRVYLQGNEAESILKQVEQYMHDTGCFKEKTLKVQDLADQLGIPAYKLSLVLNTHLRKSFKDFVNQYRIA